MSDYNQADHAAALKWGERAVYDHTVATGRSVPMQERVMMVSGFEAGARYAREQLPADDARRRINDLECALRQIAHCLSIEVSDDLLGIAPLVDQLHLANCSTIGTLRAQLLAQSCSCACSLPGEGGAA